uniref:Kinesin-like protein n=1 Tax=Dugesia japonica TaxID=6161 RepID=D5JG74_DUGJA|nr:kinesin protein 19-like protein [Dugesia japonica]
MMFSRKNTAGSSDQNLMVCLRIRPMNEDEINLDVPIIAHSMDGNVVILLDPLEDPDDILRANRSRERRFVFDNVFNSSCSQEEVFKLSTLPLISQVLDGYTATVFAYGATGTGKTYTMLGVNEQPGIMFKALESLFKHMRMMEDEFIYQMSLSYLEVYNEMIRDLLGSNSVYLDLREDQNGVQVAGLTEIDVNTTNEVMDLLNRGNAMRTVEATGANKHSSRSHAVLQVNVVSRPRIRNTQEQILKGKLFLIDLAGSERASNTLNRGKRLTEGAHINRSLLALGNCINALSDPNGKRYVNYRDSKLTRLLKDALGGNCRTVMIAHIGPSALHFEDSRNTLVYADRAKHIRTKIHKNIYDVNFHLVQYNNVISDLKLEINRLRNKLDSMQTSGDPEDNTVVVSMNEQIEEMKIKDQLLVAFQKHVDCKKILSENITNDIDLNLEETRCQAIIKEWENKKAERIPERENKSRDKETEVEEKRSEISGLSLLDEPENIKLTKNELRLTQMERLRLKTQRQKLEQDLENHSNKIKNLESSILEKVKNNHARQMLQLLCRMHKLEIQQTDLRTENIVLRQHASKHDLVQSVLMKHNELCKRIITTQSSLIKDYGIDLPKELEMLYELYSEDDITMTNNIKIGLLDIDKDLYNYDRNLPVEIDSSSDIRDMTSNVSVNEVREEDESLASLPLINNPHATPESWDNESLRQGHKKSSFNSYFQTNFDTKYNTGPKPAFENISNSNRNFMISKPPINQLPYRTTHRSILPDLRGRQLVGPIEKKSNSRSRSFEPEPDTSRNNGNSTTLNNRYANSNVRKLVVGPRLDPFGNTIYDLDLRGKKYVSKYDAYKSTPISHRPDKTKKRSTSQKKIPKSTQITKQTDERYANNHLVLRANEIKKLNERKALDNFDEMDSLNNFRL